MPSLIAGCSCLITIADAPFYASGWVASGGLDVGVIVPIGQTYQKEVFQRLNRF